MLRRWLFRILATLLVLLILAVIGIQVVLSTDLPRRLVLQEVQKQLQLRVTAKSLTTGWGGHTVLRDVTLALPLSEDSFLQMKSLEVDHSGIIAMVTTRGVTVKSLLFDGPTLLVQQDVTGRWNMADVADLLRRAAGSKQATGSGSTATAAPARPGPLPKITLRDGTVRVVDNTGRTATVGPLNITGQPEGDLVWRYDVQAGPPADPSVRLAGKVAPGDGFKHELTLDVKNLEPWLGAWAGAKPGVPSPLKDFSMNAAWQGAVGDAGLDGLLKNLNLTQGKLAIKRGSMSVQVRDGVVTLRPERLALSGLPEFPTEINLHGGSVVIENTAVKFNDLLAALAKGDARLSGRYGFDGSAEITGEWRQLAFPATFVQNGTIKAELRNQWPAGRRVQVTLVSTGLDPAGREWDAQLQLVGLSRQIGKSASTQPTQPASPGSSPPGNVSAGGNGIAMDWTLTADRLRLRKGKSVFNLDKLTARLDQTPAQLTLTGLNVPDDPAIRIAGRWPRGTLAGRGYFRPGSGDWAVWIGGDQWRLGSTPTVTKFDMNLSSSGEFTHLDELYIEGGSVRTWAAGRVSSGVRNPSHLEIYTWYPSFALDLYDAGQGLQAGSFYSEIVADGLLDPLFFNLQGIVRGKDVVARGRPVGDLSMDVRGQVDGAKDDLTDIRASLWTNHLQLFDGLWSIKGEYTSKRNSKQGGDQWDDGINIAIDLESLSLQKLDAFVSPPPKLAGTLTGHWEIAVPDAQFARMGIGGDWEIKGLKAGAFAADQITGKLGVDKGDVAIDQVRVIHDLSGKAPGQIDASARFRLKTPTQMQVKAAVAAWPIDAPGAKFSALVYGQLGGDKQPLNVDFGKLTAQGPFQFRTALTLRNHDVGEMHANGELAGRVVRINDLGGTPFGGTAGGTGVVDLDDWKLKSAVNLNWQNIDADPFVDMFPTLNGLDGKYSGSIVLGAPGDARPLGARKLTITATADHAKWRSVQLGDASLVVYYDPSEAEPDNRIERLVLSDSVIHLAGGTFKPFARLTKRPKEEVWVWDANTDFEKIDLDQLRHISDPKGKPVPGKIAGSLKVLGNPTDTRRLTGQADIRVTETELGNVSFISFLYNTLSFKFGSNEPTGRASISLRLEDNNVNVTKFNFFNRGLEAKGLATISNVWKGLDAQIQGQIVGSIRPLKDLKIPFAADFDKLLTTIQKNVTTVLIDGTLGDPRPHSGVFAELGSGLRSLIIGDVTGSTPASAGE